MATQAVRPTKYEKYRLSRLVSVNEIVSADYVRSTLSPHFHTHADAWELCCCMTGQLNVHYGEQVLLLEPGQAFCIAPDVKHTIVMQNGTAFVISFTCADEALRILRNRILQVSGEQHLLQRIVTELKLTFSRNKQDLRVFHFEPNPDAPLGAEQMICCYLEQLLISILRQITMRKGNIITGTHFERAISSYQIEAVIHYIQQHLSHCLTVEQLAQEFHYSRTRLSVLFKKATGLGINEFITRERIEQAKAMLREGNLSVSQIAEAVGYTSAQYFSRRFAMEVGCSPSVYRDMQHRCFV